MDCRKLHVKKRTQQTADFPIMSPILCQKFFLLLDVQIMSVFSGNQILSLLLLSLSALIRKFSPSSISRFHDCVARYDWLGSVSEIADLNVAFMTIVSLLSFFFNAFFPTRTVRLRSTDPEWFQLSLMIEIAPTAKVNSTSIAD